MSDELILTIKSEVCRLEGHLHECIGAETMTRNEILSVALKLERLAVILTY
jgi:hypothetical protein